MKTVFGNMTKKLKLVALFLLCAAMAVCPLLSCDDGNDGGNAQSNAPPKQETNNVGDSGDGGNGGDTEDGGDTSEDDGNSGEGTAGEDGFPQVELPFMPF